MTINPENLTLIAAAFLNKSPTGQWRPFSVAFFLALGHHIRLELL